MILEQLSIIDFKNIELASIELSSGFNCFSGFNGAGKTNTLDAIHYLSTCRSITGVADSALIRHEQPMFMVEGKFVRDSVSSKVVAAAKRGAGKSLKHNGKEYPRLSDHIGQFPLVLVSPTDSAIITDSADIRRRYIDLLLSQIDREYLSALISYNAMLKERNTMLKASKTGELLDIIDMQLGRYGDIVSHKRELFINEIEPVASEFYKEISQDREQLKLGYRSSQNADSTLEQRLSESRAKDLLYGYTTIGPHREDISMILSGHPARKYGSQGQQKSFIVALKLAQSELIVKHRGLRPILLLDDIFDKLDKTRVESLIELVSQSRFGQIFISDSNKVRMDHLLERVGGESKLFGVDDGKIEKL